MDDEGKVTDLRSATRHGKYIQAVVTEIELANTEPYVVLETDTEEIIKYNFDPPFPWYKSEPLVEFLTEHNIPINRVHQLSRYNLLYNPITDNLKVQDGTPPKEYLSMDDNPDITADYVSLKEQTITPEWVKARINNVLKIDDEKVWLSITVPTVGDITFEINYPRVWNEESSPLAYFGEQYAITDVKQLEDEYVAFGRYNKQKQYELSEKPVPVIGDTISPYKYRETRATEWCITPLSHVV